jgi:4-amino-4-deoxy-L-arabinose transferase-like glycosyltransferase
VNVVSRTGQRAGRWSWFFAWALLGAAAALGTVSLGPLLFVPTALLGVFLWRWPRLRRSAFGLLSGTGTLLLYVAWVQRDGPGTTCWHTATASGCDQHLNPLPWLIVGVALVVAGVVAHMRQPKQPGLGPVFRNDP